LKKIPGIKKASQIGRLPAFYTQSNNRTKLLAMAKEVTGIS